ncbi:MAG: heme exporter protein CcmD [Pseudomonadota bacterium]
MGEFFSMGGYAAFVWPAYGISTVALGGLAFFLARRRANARKRLEALESKRNQGDNGHG